MELATTVTVIMVGITLVLSFILAILKKTRITWVLTGSFVIIFVIQGLIEPELFQQNVSFSHMFRGGAKFIPFQAELGFSMYYFLNSPSDRWFTIITAMFTHNTMLHLLMNSVFILFIGMALEKKIGGMKFLFLFLLAGILGDIIGGMVGYIGFYSISKYSVGIGASGALFGLMGCYFYMYPNDRVWFFLNAPVWAFVLVYLLYNVFMFVLLRGQITSGSTYISYEGHIAGLVAGIIVGVVYKHTTGLKAPLPDKQKKMHQNLEKLARTKRQKEVLEKIQDEDQEDVRTAWIAEFAKDMKCPVCGKKKITFTAGKFVCQCGEIVKTK